MRRAFVVSLLLLSGCSAQDPHTNTPAFHAGPQTGTSAPINSWEVGQTAPSAPRRFAFPVETSHRGLEPYDALAETVYAALQNDGSVPLKYVTVSAQNGRVLLVGTVATQTQKDRARTITRGVAGVKTVQSRLEVRVP